MAKYTLFVVSMVLLASSSIPTRISGRSMITVTSESGMETTPAPAASGSAAAAAAGGVLRSYGGCSYNQKVHDASSVFCCDKDSLCWPSLQECMPNCPCKKNC